MWISNLLNINYSWSNLNCGFIGSIRCVCGGGRSNRVIRTDFNQTVFWRNRCHFLKLQLHNSVVVTVKPCIKRQNNSILGHSTFNKDILHSTRTFYIQQVHSTLNKDNLHSTRTFYTQQGQSTFNTASHEIIFW
jgi:hypothetical protein